MDKENNQYKQPHHLPTQLDHLQISAILTAYIIENLPKEFSIPPASRFFTDYEGNVYLESGLVVSSDANIATLVNAVNILSQGHSQIGSWKPNASSNAKLPTILIVDDESTARYITRSTLEAEIEAHYIEAENGNVAMKICYTQRPDLVILDMMMPIKNGFDTSIELNQLGIPFIALTSLSDVENVQKVVDLGCISFLSKPASYAQLTGGVLSALKQINKRKLFHQEIRPSSDVYTARGALAAYLSISPDQAYQVIREMSRDSHSNSKETASIVNQFLEFIGKANNKHQAQLKRKEKQLNRSRKEKHE